ncbi:MAG: DUF3024 domain-containing protein [FCB group bacterium]|nr:DUF3024 domain-containing protein [FCB group bacterium]
MPFKPEELPLIESYFQRYCDKKNKPEIFDKLHLEYEIEDQSIILMEVRQHWQDPNKQTRTEVAKIRYIRSTNIWKLYWMRQDLKWHLYEPHPEDFSYVSLLEVIDEDEFCCFFG